MLQAQLSRLFTISELADVVGKDIATVRKWFEKTPGVRRYPRGYSTQKPSLVIPEPIARGKLKDIGLTDEEIHTLLIEPHDARCREEEEREKNPPPVVPKRPTAKSKSKKTETTGRRPRK
jgi:hypothetical protein